MEATGLKQILITSLFAAGCFIDSGAIAASHAAVASRASDAGAQQESGVDVIPAPAHVEPRSGVFAIRADTRLSIPRDPRAARVALYFAALMRKSPGLEFATAGTGSAGTIVFQISPDSPGMAPGPESYSIDISADRIVLDASDPRGLLYAAVTLWELSTSHLKQGGADGATNPIELAAMRIVDSPRLAWRGLMLDSARHYQSPQFITNLIDWMALHKLNVLHWHLTDDQAWRLEIRKYPRLTSVGAWRVPAGAGPAADIDPTTGKPRLYGGFYSQQVVRQIVAHAADRNVTIVPEIDMPGHASAAIVAYPRLATALPAPTAVPADWGVYPNLYNTDAATFQFLQDVLAEVIDLFPGRLVHIGGDEAVKDQWQASPRVRQQMRALGVRDTKALQSYFVERIGRYLSRHGRRLIGWDEILEGGIEPDATVMSWRGIDGALTAAALGHDSVLSADPTLYFDNRQGNTTRDPPGRGRIISLEDVYKFEPMPAALPPDRQHYILGLQANIWTEHIRTEDRVEYMTFPRAAAVAEIGWSSPSKVSWEDFIKRIPAQLNRYNALGIHYSDDAFAVAVAPVLDRPRGRVQVQLSNQTGVGRIHYTLDGSEPTAESPVFPGSPLDLVAAGQIRATAFIGTRALSASAARALDIPALETRSSHELKSCTSKLVLSLEDDAPSHGERANFLVDILNPCWIYTGADLSHVTALATAVGQVPFNFQIGAAVRSIKFREPSTAAGELEARLDTCDGEVIAAIGLGPAVDNSGVTRLPDAKLASRTGRHDLCFTFTQRSPDPLWALDWVQLLE